MEAAKLGLEEGPIAEKPADDYSEILPPVEVEGPENMWADAKRRSPSNCASPSMDKLMSLIGLKDVKMKAVSVALKTLLCQPSVVNSKTRFRRRTYNL